jgi:hypothetical protein
MKRDWRNVYWIEVAQNRVQWSDLPLTVLNYQVLLSELYIYVTMFRNSYVTGNDSFLHYSIAARHVSLGLS